MKTQTTKNVRGSRRRAQVAPSRRWPLRQPRRHLSRNPFFGRRFENLYGHWVEAEELVDALGLPPRAADWIRDEAAEWSVTHTVVGERVVFAPQVLEGDLVRLWFERHATPEQRRAAQAKVCANVEEHRREAIRKLPEWMASMPGRAKIDGLVIVACDMLEDDATTLGWTPEGNWPVSIRAENCRRYLPEAAVGGMPIVERMAIPRTLYEAWLRRLPPAETVAEPTRPSPRTVTHRRTRGRR